jgi:ATP-binding cassette subfamily C (CFTR/MRP) protein 1
MEVTDGIVTFVMYGVTGHNLDAAVIFTGLQFFNVLKTPISQLPMIITALLDAIVGLSEWQILRICHSCPRDHDEPADALRRTYWRDVTGMCSDSGV